MEQLWTAMENAKMEEYVLMENANAEVDTLVLIVNIKVTFFKG
jgi:hypothetical protein